MRVVLPIVILAAALVAAITDDGAIAIVFTFPVLLAISAVRWPRSLPIAAVLVPTGLVVSFVDGVAHLFTEMPPLHDHALLVLFVAPIAHLVVAVSRRGSAFAERAPGLVTLLAGLAAMALAFVPHHRETACHEEYAEQDVDHFCMWECDSRDESPPMRVCESVDIEPSEATHGLAPLCLFAVLVLGGLAAGRPRNVVFAACAAGAAGLAAVASLPVISVRWPLYAGGGRAYDASIGVMLVGAIALVHAIWKRRRTRPIPEARAQ